jgi:predicted AAA+ superfamily ATPase
MNATRTIKKEMDIYLNKYPILVLTGPRQSGKTTFLKSQFPTYSYINLENLDNRNFALLDPNGFLTEHNQFVIFDEVQRVPELFSYIQTKVDDGIAISVQIARCFFISIQREIFFWFCRRQICPDFFLF